MLAAYTTSSPSPGGLVGLEDVKAYLGIYSSSTSDDNLIKGIIEAATSHASIHLEEPLADTEVIDFYPSLASRLELTHEPLVLHDPHPEYFFEDSWNLYAGGSHVDRTSTINAVVLGDYLPVEYDNVVNPVRIRYDTMARVAILHFDLVKTAIMLLARVLYDERSTEIDSRIMTMIFRRLDQVRRRHSNMSI